MDTRSLVQQIMDTTSTWLDEQLRSDGRQSEPQATCRPLLGHWMADPSSAHLASVQNWCHPFGSRANALQQLIQQAKAERGYYPLGRNGYWHLGVHFDVGTAGTMDQAYVRCLADGEVVAYRIDTQSPCTTYHLDGEPVERVFSRNFVLVRHRLQAPEISGVDDTPPSLTFFSLYMHLQDWEPYAESPELSRPGFWPLAARYQVNPNVRDTHAGSPGVVGLRVRNQATRGKVIGLLPHGTAVTINGQGDFREWIDSPGPVALQNPDGSLRGYVAFSNLRPNASGSYRVQLNQDNSTLNVRAEPNGNSEVLFKLPQGTEVTISGEGQFRKLERVNQYLHYASLMSEREPDALDRILVLDKPVPIRAGELIGHLGNYQDLEDVVPQQQLHLEVFSHEDVEAFMDVSRAWAKHLPASSRTWLTLPQGTSVVPHQEYFSVAGPPSVGVDTPTSAAELHLPKQQLDGLGAEKTLRIPARNGEDGCTWYRLDDLLHDVEGLLLKGWVRVEDNNAQWHSPWDWSGYAAILNGDSLESCQAYALKVQGILPSEKDRARAAQLADLSDRGPIRNRLFDLIGRGPNPGEVMSAEQLQQALRLPAQAQSVSRLAIYSESDWYWRPGKWDVLDDLYGHRSLAPHINWLAEKERIESLSWWHAVALNLALPTDGQVWHLNPISIIGLLSEKRHPIINLNGRSVELDFLGIYKGHDINDGDIRLAAEDLGCEPGLIYAIAKQESSKSSFVVVDGEIIPSILFERHWFKRIAKDVSVEMAGVDIYGSPYKRARRIDGQYIEVGTGAVLSDRDVYGPSGRAQYSRLIGAYELDQDAALQSCSWGKFQIMGFNYRSAGYESVKDFTMAMSLGDAEHIKAFLSFAKKNSTLLRGLREKNFDLIAEGHNGAGWRLINPDYSSNIERYYNEYHK